MNDTQLIIGIILSSWLILSMFSYRWIRSIYRRDKINWTIKLRNMHLKASIFLLPILIIVCVVIEFLSETDDNTPSTW